MRFAAPYVLYSSLLAPRDGRVAAHVEGYRQLIEAIRDDRHDFDAAERLAVLMAKDLPLMKGAGNG